MNGDGKTVDVLWNLLRTHSQELRTRTTTVDVETELTALGVDSLELLSIAADVERTFDIDIDDAAVGSAKTVAQLAALIDEQRGAAGQ